MASYLGMQAPGKNPTSGQVSRVLLILYTIFFPWAFMKFRKSLPIFFLTGAVLSGCSRLEPSVKVDDAFRKTDDEKSKAAENVIGLDDDAEAVVRIPISPLILRPVLSDIPDGRAAWPPAKVKIRMIPAGVTFQDAIELVVTELRAGGYQKDVGIVVRDPDLARQPINLMKNISGSFQSVIERIAENAGGIATWREDSIEIARTASFTVPLPPLYDDTLSDSVATQITKLISEKKFGADGKAEAPNPGQTVETKADKGSKTLVFQVNAAQLRRIEEFLLSLRGRPLLVFQCYVWDVTLNDQNEFGINWQQLGRSVGTSALTGGIVPGNGTSFVSDLLSQGLNNGATAGSQFTAHGIRVNVLANFLRSQGRTKTIVNPRVQLISGSTGKFQDAGTQRIITDVSQQSISAGLTTTVLPTTTVHEDIPYGTKLTITGDLYGDTVWGKIDLKYDSIINIDTSNGSNVVGGIHISTPQVAHREIDQLIRAVPGDTVILGSTHQKNKTSTKTGPAEIAGTLPSPTDDNDTESVGEMVMAVKVRLVQFDYGDRREADLQPAAAVKDAAAPAEADAAEPAKPVEMAKPALPHETGAANTPTPAGEAISELKEDLPKDLMKKSTLAWSGALAPAVKTIADEIGYKFIESGRAPSAAVNVDIHLTDRSIYQILDELGQQTGSRANIVVNLAARTIEIRYVHV